MAQAEEIKTKDIGAIESRLREIEEVKLGVLSDEEAAALIAERTSLRKQIEEAEKEKNAAKEKAARITELKKQIANLSHEIAGEKTDEEILDIVSHRKTLEAELAELQKPTPAPTPEPAPQKESAPSPPAAGAESPEEKAPTEPVAVQAVPAPSAPKPAPAPEKKKDIGDDGIKRESAIEGEFEKYLDQVKGHPDSLGSVLQGLPTTVRRHKHFMLEVAAIDPAYAMHYAETSLKKDEDFNVKVASMPNKRGSGNALAEMLPEARTDAVVVAGVKNDYRNVRFARPEMPSYRDILDIAKKGALDKVKAMKNGVDPMLLVPKQLQNDKAFMDEVKKIAPQES